jgi:hypothetical protein
MRLRAEALEPELNAAILEIGREDFLLGNFDLQSLFSESLNRYYSDEVVLWLGGELTNGKQAAFQRLADVLERCIRFLRWDWAALMSFWWFLVSRIPKAISSASGKRSLADLTQPRLSFVGARSVSGNNGSSSQNE